MDESRDLKARLEASKIDLAEQGRLRQAAEEREREATERFEAKERSLSAEMASTEAKFAKELAGAKAKLGEELAREAALRSEAERRERALGLDIAELQERLSAAVRSRDESLDTTERAMEEASRSTSLADALRKEVAQLRMGYGEEVAALEARLAAAESEEKRSNSARLQALGEQSRLANEMRKQQVEVAQLRETVASRAEEDGPPYGRGNFRNIRPSLDVDAREGKRDRNEVLRAKLASMQEKNQELSNEVKRTKASAGRAADLESDLIEANARNAELESKLQRGSPIALASASSASPLKSPSTAQKNASAWGKLRAGSATTQQRMDDLRSRLGLGMNKGNQLTRVVAAARARQQAASVEKSPGGGA